MKGSTANIEAPTNILTTCARKPRRSGRTRRSASRRSSIRTCIYFGYPGYRRDEQNYPAYSEVGFAGWKFKT